jgi:hypothetical protein
MILNSETLVVNPEPAFALAFPVPREQDDSKRIFAEYAILGGMLNAKERFIRSGANVDWSHPMSEAIARACVEAWERHGADSDEAWRCNVGAFLARYTGRSPLCDSAMLAWCQYLMGIYRMKFDKEGLDAEIAAEKMLCSVELVAQ